MVTTRLATAPTHELPIITTENNVKTIYCVEIALTQADLGYEVPPADKPRPAALADLQVFADTVVLNQPLVLPGRNVTIVTRVLVLSPGASIDVSGATATTSYAPGDTPQQTNMAAGAPGSAGGAANGGGAAGNVTIVADEIVGTGTGSFGAATLDVLNVSDALVGGLTTARAQLAASIAPFTLPMQWMHIPWGNNPNPYPFKYLAGSLQFGELAIKGLGDLTIDACQPAVGGLTTTLRLSAPRVECAMTPTLTITQLDNPGNLNGTKQAIALTMPPVSMRATATIRSDAHTWRLGDVQVDVALGGTPGVQASPAQPPLAAIGQCVADMLNQQSNELVTRLTAAVATALRQKLADIVDATNRTLGAAPPHLVAMAHGGRGGRGQDGHAGIKGAKGEDGKPTNTIVYEDAAGRYTTPPETAGKQGTKGGKAGSAGTSGSGGAGGQIVIEHMKAWPLRIVAAIDGGAGGDAGAPGARGQGGDGGDGHTFFVREITMQGNYGHDEQGPDGPRGPEGDAADFAGKPGAQGAAGHVTANGAAVTQSGAALAAYHYEQMALRLRLDQLLMVQREASLAYLNGTAGGDFSYAAGLFLWLCNVSPGSVTDSKATNALTAEDRQARAAIRGAAQVELLRLQRGLDYFGHPYNWAPVLRLSHLQKRATELIALGKIVEEQYAIYVNTNASVTEKLAALDQTLQALGGDLEGNRAAETVLGQQIVLAEGAIASLQTEMESQITDIRHHQEAVDRAIAKQIDANCNLENVFKIISAIVAVGAGAFNGISEIAGVAQLEAIVKEAKAAATAAGQAKAAIETITKTAAKLKDLAGTLSAVDGAINAGKPDAVKILVAKKDFEETLKPLMEKVPEPTKELRSAVRAFFDLAQSRNEKIVAYNALFVQKAALATQREQIAAQIAAVNAIKSTNRGALVPAPYLTFFKSALRWSKQHLIDLLYEETRAFYYHSGASQAALLEKVSDLNVGSLADTQARLLTAYDQFLTTVGRPYAPFTDIAVSITRPRSRRRSRRWPPTGA